MKQEKVQRVIELTRSISNLEYTIECLKNERDAKLTGLDYKTPGARHHVLRALENQWELVGDKCVEFFVEVMNATIRQCENKLLSLRIELDDL
jgi:hypothetical protein